MARKFRLALAQINPIVGDLPGNTAMMLECLRQAREGGADLVAFPELATTGYPPEDLLFKKSFVDENVSAMQEVVAASQGIAVVLGYVQPRENGVANSAAVGYDGRLIDTYDKIFLPNYGVFDEERYFVKGAVCPVYEISGVQVGVNVCEDIWNEVRSVIGTAPRGGRTDSQHQCVALSRRKERLPARQHRRQPRHRERTVRCLSQHRRRAG